MAKAIASVEIEGEISIAAAGGDCCCGAACDCNASCRNRCYKFAAAGITGGLNCADYDLPYEEFVDCNNSFAPDAKCFWSWSGGSTHLVCSTGTAFGYWFLSPPGGIVLRVSTPSVKWQLMIRCNTVTLDASPFALYETDTWDCAGPNTLDYVSSESHCTGWPATITVTSVDINEKQRVHLYQNVTVGTFRISFRGQDTAALAFGISAAALESALEAVSTIGGGNVSVTAFATGTYNRFDVEFVGSLAHQNVPLMGITMSGVLCAALNEKQEIRMVTGPPTLGNFTLAFDGQLTGLIAYNASAATVQAALEGLSNIGSGNILCTGGPLPGTILCTFVGTLAGVNQPTMILVNLMVGGTYGIVTTQQGGETDPACTSAAALTLILEGCGEP